jgi:peptidoglycan lytic transglycosylase
MHMRIAIMQERNGQPMNRTIFAIRQIFAISVLASALATGAAHAQGIDALLIENVPVPQPRPQATPVATAPAVAPNIALAADNGTPRAIRTNRHSSVAPQRGSLENGLKALSERSAQRALAIRAAFPEGSLDRKILSWAIALSGLPGISSGDFGDIASELPDWPGQSTMRSNAEIAMASENLGASEVIAAFGNGQPETVNGAVALARAYLSTGNTARANAAIAPKWHDEELSESREKRILAQVGRALTRDDHRFRMHMQFYRERTRDGMRMAALAEQYSLAQARTAVIKNAGNADALLKAVKAPSNKDAAYLFSQIKRARRDGDYKKAATLMAKAPSDPVLLVDPDEWWIERRLISRGLLDAGDARGAYQVAAGHAAESPQMQAEAEFHAGWFALRYLNDPATARRHFETLRRLTETPISQARANYWIARTTDGDEAARYYREAARYSGTFYGQLAAQKIGARALDVHKPSPTAADRSRFASRDLVRAIERLEATDNGWRAEAIYRRLAELLDSPGEVAILAARAEKQGKHNLALQIGKIAYSRGLAVDTVSWPIGAIPANAQVSGAGKALAYAVARQESAFDAGAVSPASAKGLLQLMPGTAKLMAKKLGVSYSAKKLTNDPRYNVALGSAYLAEQLDNFSNSYILTFAGYNAGPGRVKEWIAKYGDPRALPVERVIDWIERIPFTETRNYVQRVMENYQVYKARLGSSQLDIESDLRHGRR